MKAYYITGAIVAVLALFLSFAITGISSCVSGNKQISDVKDKMSDSVVVRYYMSDDYDNAQIVYLRVYDTDNYSIEKFPRKTGYTFAGLYDGKDYLTSQLYVTGDGYGIKTLTQDVLLYPVFVTV
jgi:hypothetical protein